MTTYELTAKIETIRASINAQLNYMRSGGLWTDEMQANLDSMRQQENDLYNNLQEAQSKEEKAPAQTTSGYWQTRKAETNHYRQTAREYLNS